MKLNKSLWLSQEWSSKKKMPSWPCPICHTGILLKESDSIKQLYTEETLSAQRSNFSEVSGTAEFRFVGYLKCSHCSERILIAGKGIFLNEFGSPASAAYLGKKISVFYPRYFEPALHIIDVPPSLNKEVQELVVKSFMMYWVDLDSCANKIRQALELVVKEQGATRRGLHHQIESLRGTIGERITNRLLALKMIGNEGSHASRPFEKSEILDAYDLLEDVLAQLYPDHTDEERKENLVQKIISNKGLKKA
jgi:hypothetical protein